MLESQNVHSEKSTSTAPHMDESVSPTAGALAMSCSPRRITAAAKVG